MVELQNIKIGRIALVTGANKGVGYHIAAQLAACGLFRRVVLGCRSLERGRAAARELNGETVKVDVVKVDVADLESCAECAEIVESMYGRLDCLVNKAGIAFKASDPTPFEGQTGPTLQARRSRRAPPLASSPRPRRVRQTNYWGTLALTDACLPLLLRGPDPRIVNVASMSGRLSQLSTPLQAHFSALDLTRARLDEMVREFEAAVARGTHVADGWPNSNYGLSKCALIAATGVLARDNPSVKVNACCPGYCDTDMSSHQGPRPPEEGARNAVMLATLPFDECPTGDFWQDCAPSTW